MSEIILIRGVQIEFSCRKIQITCSKIEFGLIEENLPPIFYHWHWYFVVVIGSIQNLGHY